MTVRPVPRAASAGPLRRRARRLASAAAALALVAGIVTPGAQAAIPPQGVYEQCAPGKDACLARLDQIRAAGFTVVLNYMQWYGRSAEIRRYSAHAAALGIKLIYPLNAGPWRGAGALRTTYRELGSECPCADDASFAVWALELVKEDPATWGWYIGDEADPTEVQAVQALADRVAAVDPMHPQLYISYENSATNGANLRPFATVADVIGSDYYPFGTPFGLEATGDLAEEIQKMAAAGGRSSALVLQAFSWGQYPHSAQISAAWPTREQMARQRNLALARAEPDLILWYSFFDVTRSDDPSGHWDDLAAAAFSPEPLPETTIVRARAPLGGDRRTAEFATESDLAADFECSLDADGWEPCPPVTSYSRLQDGEHSFLVRARLKRGRPDPTPAAFDWTVPPPTGASAPPPRPVIGPPDTARKSPVARCSRARRGRRASSHAGARRICRRHRASRSALSAQRRRRCARRPSKRAGHRRCAADLNKNTRRTRCLATVRGVSAGSEAILRPAC